MKNELLLIPDKADVEREALAKIWEENGGEVKRIGKFWVKPETNGKRIVLYGPDSFCLVLAQVLDLDLISPKDEMIAELNYLHLKRKVEIKYVNELTSDQFPQFIKSVKPKFFQAAIYQSLAEFYDKNIVRCGEEQLICSEIINIEKKVRAFILNQNVEDLAFYEGEGSIDSAKQFIDDFLETCEIELPRTFVLDVGYNELDGWFIIEFNASWGALNFCNPRKVINCIRETTSGQFNQ